MSEPIAKDEDILSSIRRLVTDKDTYIGYDADSSPAATEHTPIREALILTSALRVDETTKVADLADGVDKHSAGFQETPVSDGQAAPLGADTTHLLNGLHLSGAPDTQPGQDPSSDLDSLRQAVAGAFIGDPVMPAVVHSTGDPKKPASMPEERSSAKEWGKKPSDDYYEDQLDEELAADMAVASPWGDALTAGHVAEDIRAGDPRTADDDQTDLGAALGANTAPTDLSGEVGSDRSQDVEAADITEQVTSDDLVHDTLKVDQDAAELKSDISDDYEWDEDGVTTTADSNIATFRHAPPEPEHREEAMEPATGAAAALLASNIGADMLGRGEGSDVHESQKPLELNDFDETIIDEETLRELVSDIVRQELSGDLGERITRNVRKLVRREIYRALQAQELD